MAATDDILNVIAEVEKECREKERAKDADGLARLAWGSAGDTCVRIRQHAAIISRRASDDHIREVAGMAEEIAFWAYQAKAYFARANNLGNYDELPPSQQRAIDATFDEARRAENRDRIGHVEPAHDIGS